jgi:hypothetical protein
MSDWLRDLRYAARVLWKNRTASVVAFITPALAIGATTAIVTVVDATLVRALPFPEGDRLVLARSVDPEQPVTHVRLMREIVGRSLGSQRFNTVLLGQPHRSRGVRARRGGR